LQAQLRLVYLLEEGLGEEHVQVRRQLERRAEALDEAQAPVSEMPPPPPDHREGLHGRGRTSAGSASADSSDLNE